MVDTGESTVQRSYGCSLGCGNPYDFVIVMVSGAETQFLCTPCFVQQAGQMLEAMINPDNPEIQRMLSEVDEVEQPPMNGVRKPRRGHEAPAELNDPDAIEAFDSYILEDELPDAFK